MKKRSGVVVRPVALLLAAALLVACGGRTKNHDHCGAKGEDCCDQTNCDEGLECFEQLCQKRGSAELGEPCEADVDCADSRCIETGTGSVCSEPCDGEPGSCISGWECSIDKGLSSGTCQCEASDEVCDGKDNDCNGILDDKKTVDTACNAEIEGAVCMPSNVCGCPSDESVCDGKCVSLAADSNNCGTCGHKCSKELVCGGGECVPPSCAAGLKCRDENCCVSLEVPGGTFPMGRSEDGTDAWKDATSGYSSELPEHDVTVSDFRLDKYEVTVSRMRAFVEAYDEWRSAGHPEPGEGAHPLIPGSGWQEQWWALPEDREELVAALQCPDWNADDQMWSDEPGARETRPLDCVQWYVAFAFCAWDGGRLPTEAEWEYAAAGGDENRRYASGAGPATYNCTSDETLQDCMQPVGSVPEGDGRFGQADLTGSVCELTLDVYDKDWYSTGGQDCIDCANLDPLGRLRTARGGSVTSDDPRVAYREWLEPEGNSDVPYGIRCAR
jgi:formylglycine-generating enzyme